MKKKFVMIVLIAAFAMVTLNVEAQNTSQPKWISKYGYWVIESNRSAPKNATILFYNNNNVLVYSEKVEGVKLNTRNKKTLIKLKEVLEESLIAWNQKESAEGKQLVKNIFGN